MENELKLQIQEEVKTILEKFYFSENTEENRKTIKSEIDGYLSELANEKTIWNFFTNVTENETKVYIEPEKERGVYVNEFYMVKNDEIKNNGFNLF